MVTQHSKNLWVQQKQYKVGSLYNLCLHQKQVNRHQHNGIADKVTAFHISILYTLSFSSSTFDSVPWQWTGNSSRKWCKYLGYCHPQSRLRWSSWLWVWPGSAQLLCQLGKEPVDRRVLSPNDSLSIHNSNFQINKPIFF